MSQAESTSASTASENNSVSVAVIPTGIAGSPRYISDMEGLAEAVMSEINGIAGNIGQSIDEVVVRGSYEVAEALDDAVGSDGPDVDNYSIDFRVFLDDMGEETDDYEIPSVMGEGDPVVSAVAQHEELTANEIENFDLNDRDDRSMVGYEVLEELEDDRIGRAKAKSKAKATERLLSDYFDSVPTTDHVVILEDGTDNHEPAAQEVRGSNDWVKYPSECGGKIRPVRLSGGEDGVLDWTRALLDSGGIEVEDLSEDQEERLRERLDEEELADLGLDVDGSVERPDEEATAVAGSSAAPADD